MKKRVTTAKLRNCSMHRPPTIPPLQVAAGSTSVFVPAERPDGEDSDTADTEGSAQAEASLDASTAGNKLAAAAAAKEASTGDSGISTQVRVEAPHAKQAMPQGGPGSGAAGLAALQAKVAAAERHGAAAEQPTAPTSPRGRALHSSLSIFEREAAATAGDAGFTIPTAPQWEDGEGRAEQGQPAEEGELEEQEEDDAGEEEIAGLSGSPDIAVNLLPAGQPLSSAAAADRAALESWRRSSSIGNGSGGQKRGSLRGGLRRRTTSTQGEP